MHRAGIGSWGVGGDARNDVKWGDVMAATVLQPPIARPWRIFLFGGRLQVAKQVDVQVLRMVKPAHLLRFYPE